MSAAGEYETSAPSPDVLLSNLLSLAGFNSDPAIAIRILMLYGLSRLEAGLQGVWPDHAPNCVASSRRNPPEPIARILRIDGLGITLATAKCASTLGIEVHQSCLQQLRIAAVQYMSQDALIKADLSYTEKMITLIGRNELLEMIASFNERRS